MKEAWQKIIRSVNIKARLSSMSKSGVDFMVNRVWPFSKLVFRKPAFSKAPETAVNTVVAFAVGSSLTYLLTRFSTKSADTQELKLTQDKLEKAHKRINELEANKETEDPKRDDLLAAIKIGTATLAIANTNTSKANTTAIGIQRDLAKCVSDLTKYDRLWCSFLHPSPTPVSNYENELAASKESTASLGTKP